MKIALIGSSQYQRKFESITNRLCNLGHIVRSPAFDSHESFDELSICEYNRALIEWADEIHVIWDNRSVGTVLDFGMAFALRKKVVIEYIEPKTLENVMRKYAGKSSDF